MLLATVILRGVSRLVLILCRCCLLINAIMCGIKSDTDLVRLSDYMHHANIRILISHNSYFLIFCNIVRTLAWNPKVSSIVSVQDWYKKAFEKRKKNFSILVFTSLLSILVIFQGKRKSDSMPTSYHNQNKTESSP